jgi:3-oxoacyl-[acyl-carrier protein] reductase
MMLRLEGKRALITGSSRGIGLGIARALHAEGARVMVTGRTATTVDAACAALDNGGQAHRTLPAIADLTAADGIASIVDRVQAVWQGLDLLVLNLGSGRSVPHLNADLHEWRRVFDLNVFGAMEMLRQAVPLLRRGTDASVVLVGSIAGLEALDAPWAYGAAKAALTHASKQAARHLAADGIRVNLVALGHIFFAGGTWDERRTTNAAEVERMLQTQVPQRRFGTVDEAAAAVAFLASPISAFTTGACLVVDGGLTRHV